MVEESVLSLYRKEGACCYRLMEAMDSHTA